MSILKSRGLPRTEKPAELEGNIRELVRRESNAIRQAADGSGSEHAARELSSLVHRISDDSTREVDHLIAGLTNVRKKLDEEARRIQRDIMDFASLSQSVVQLTKIVSDSMTNVEKVSDAPAIAAEAPMDADTVDSNLHQPH